MTKHQLNQMIFHSNKQQKEKKLEPSDSSFFMIKILYWLIIIWGIFIIAHYLIVGNFWFGNVLSIIPPIVLLLASIIMFFLSFFLLLDKKQESKKFIIGISVAALTIFISFPLTDIYISSPRILDNGDFSIFTFNTEYWEREERLPDLFDFLREQNADVYHLQEFFPEIRMNGYDQEGLSKTIDDLRVAFPNYEIIQLGEFVTMSRLPISQYEYNPEGAYLKTDIWVNDKIVSFYNVHVPVHINLRKNFVTIIPDIKDRFYWREEVFDILENEIAENTRPKIVTGDFNTTKAMRSMEPLLNSLTDSKEFLGKAFEASWEISGMYLWRIDYILGNEDIKFKTYETLDSGILSDHEAIRVTYDL